MERVLQKRVTMLDSIKVIQWLKKKYGKKGRLDLTYKETANLVMSELAIDVSTGHISGSCKRLNIKPVVDNGGGWRAGTRTNGKGLKATKQGEK